MAHKKWLYTSYAHKIQQYENEKTNILNWMNGMEREWHNTKWDENFSNIVPMNHVNSLSKEKRQQKASNIHKEKQKKKKKENWWRKTSCWNECWRSKVSIYVCTHTYTEVTHRQIDTHTHTYTFASLEYTAMLLFSQRTQTMVNSISQSFLLFV